MHIFKDTITNDYGNDNKRLCPECLVDYYTSSLELQQFQCEEQGHVFTEDWD